jgi:hypothetical protein
MRPDGSGKRRFPVGLVIRLALLAALFAALHYGGAWLVAEVEGWFLPLYTSYGPPALVVVVSVYVVMMALPFVPGIEVSLALLMILGVEGIGVVYLSTLLALCLSFAVGRLIPSPLLERFLGWLHLARAQGLVRRLSPLSPQQKLDLLVELAPLRAIPFLLRHRYLAVAIAFNLPGNALVGGGGGIGLMAGVSGLFHFPRYVLMVSLAISPIPLLLLTRSWLFPPAA